MLPQVTFRGVFPSQNVVDAVWRNARSLHALVPEVAECHVVIEALSNDRKRHPWYNVIVHTTASTLSEPRKGRNAACDDNVFFALRDAFGLAYENLVTQPPHIGPDATRVTA